MKNEWGHMQNNEFTPEERDALISVLQHGLSEIDVEIFRTDTREFKDKLKHRREVLLQALVKLESVPLAA